MLICDIATVGATTHYLHLALHVGLASVVTLGGGIFLALGARANRRSRRERATAGSEPSRGTGSG